MKSKKVLIPIFLLILTIVVGAAVFFVVSANSPEKKLTRQLDLGAKYLNEEDYKQAIAAFDVAISIDPKNVDAYLGKAEAYIGLEDYESAIDTLVAGYDETESNKLKKELQKVVEDYVEGLIDDGDVDEAIELMEDIQDEIGEDIFEDILSDLVENDDDIDDELKDDVKEDDSVSELIDETGENLVELEYAYSTRVSVDYWDPDAFYSNYPEAMWDGGIEVFPSYDMDGAKITDAAYICCGVDILNSVELPMYDGGVDLDITFTYSYAEESTDKYGEKVIIYHDAEISYMQIHTFENVGGNTFETMVLQDVDVVLIEDGVVVGVVPL